MSKGSDRTRPPVALRVQGKTGAVGRRRGRAGHRYHQASPCRPRACAG